MSHWCTTHPRYQAARTPKSLCGACWQLYFLRNPEEKSRIEDVYRQAEMLRVEIEQPG